MALQFPLNPTVGDLYQTGSSATYEFTDRSYWEVVQSSPLEIITATSASFATSASHAVTASYALNTADDIPTYLQLSRGATPQQQVPPGIITGINNFPAVFSQNAGEWNATTGTFTVAKAGVYKLSLFATFSSTNLPANTVISSILLHNGAILSEAWNYWNVQGVATEPGGGTAIGLRSFNVGDTIRFAIFHNMVGLTPDLRRCFATIEELPARIKR